MAPRNGFSRGNFARISRTPRKNSTAFIPMRTCGHFLKNSAPSLQAPGASARILKLYTQRAARRRNLRMNVCGSRGSFPERSPKAESFPRGRARRASASICSCAGWCAQIPRWISDYGHGQTRAICSFRSIRTCSRKRPASGFSEKNTLKSPSPQARKIMKSGDFMVVYCTVEKETAEERLTLHGETCPYDYAKAQKLYRNNVRRYYKSEKTLELDTTNKSIDECVELIVEKLKEVQ